MKFTDLFIRRPVLAMVVSLLLLVLGLRSLYSLPVNEFPQTENAVVTVSTTYFGADAQTIAGFITQPLEAAISQAQGIDYLSSSSTSGVSTITATLRLNYDSNRALTEINTQVNSVRNQLPPQAQVPVLTVQTGQTVDAMYIGFYSDELPTNNITDYLVRVVKPKLDAVQGVQTAEILGARNFALRAWLDTDKMAAFGVTAADVSAALAANNYLAALGSTKGQMVTIPLAAGTDLHTVEEFRQLAVNRSGDALVRLRDVAEVTLGSENYDFNVAFSGKRSVFIGIKAAPDANILDVAKRVRTLFPEIQQQLPSGLVGEIVYDSTEFINTSIQEVVKTLVEALLIVAAVIYLFLGSFRAVAVPLIAMPLSLIGAFFVMLVLGYSINLLTLLALVLAIGLVVDDAIIVVENVDRHMKEGQTPMNAALIAARELGGPIVAMTVVLIAVYIPIGFQGGLTGALFTEFAFTLAGAVTVSGVIALTLSPMMASRIFKPEQDEGRFVKAIDRVFDKVHRGYARALHSVLDTWVVMIVMGALLMAAAGAMFVMSTSELAPQEDQGIVGGQVVGPSTATTQQMQTYAQQIFDVAKALPEYEQMFQLTGVPSTNQGFAGVLFKPWEQRTRSAKELQQALQAGWNNIAGARVAAFQFPPLPGSSGLPVQFVISTTEPFENLNTVAQEVLAKANAAHLFYFADTDLKIDKPQATLVVDRDMVSALGLTQQQRVGAGQHGEAREPLDHRRHVGEISGAVLDADDDAGEGLQQPGDQVVRDRHLGDLRDVIQHHLQPVVADPLDHRGIEAEQSLVTDALVVERRQQHRSPRTAFHRVAGQRDGFRHVAARGAGQQLIAGEPRRQRGIQQRMAFGQREAVRLAGGAQQGDAMAALGDQRTAMGGEQVQPRRAVGADGRGCGREHAADGRGPGSGPGGRAGDGVGHAVLPAARRRA